MFSLEIVLKAHDLSSPRMCMILPMESLGFSSLAAYIWQTMFEVLLSCICPLWLGERKVSTLGVILARVTKCVHAFVA